MSATDQPTADDAPASCRIRRGAPADGGGRAAAEITADEALRSTGHSPAPIARDCAPGPGPGGTSVTTPGVHGHGRTH